MVYHEPMKKWIRALFTVTACVAFFTFALSVQAQVKLDLTPDELLQFRTLGYIKRTQFSFDTNERHIQARIQPIQLENQGTVQFKADNGDGGKVFVQTHQVSVFTSIDGQRILITSCCEKLYKEKLSFTPLNWSNVLDKSFTVDLNPGETEKTGDTSETGDTAESGTFNALIEVYIYPSY